ERHGQAGCTRRICGSSSDRVAPGRRSCPPRCPLPVAQRLGDLALSPGHPGTAPRVLGSGRGTRLRRTALRCRTRRRRATPAPIAVDVIQSDLLLAVAPVVAALEQLGVAYSVVGSIASSAHGVARASIDADLVV